MDELKRLYEAGLRLKRRVFARVVLEWAKRDPKTYIAKPSRKPVELSVGPKQSRSVLFTDLRRGRYRMRVQHDSWQIKKNRRSLIGRFTASSGDRAALLAKQLEINYSERVGAFSYLGGGRTRRDRTVQVLDLHIPHALGWLKVSFDNQIDQYVNVEELSLFKYTAPLSKTSRDLAPLVQAWVATNPALLDVEYVLYADINMNVVDGSSIWFSSMASILGASGKTLLITKEKLRSDIVWANVTNKDAITRLSPEDLGQVGGVFDLDTATSLLRALDEALPNVRRIVVRGRSAAFALADTRQFYARSCIYLTDFYTIENGERIITDAHRDDTTIALLHAGHVLSQTNAISKALKAETGLALKPIALPPPIPDDLPTIDLPPIEGRRLQIGYAGKVVPNWGVDQMLDWLVDADVDLFVVANRISSGTGAKAVPGFAEGIHAALARTNVTHHADFNREQSMDLMAQMDFVWCYRPSELEDNTLELSTKLVEMVAAGQKCICYPSAMNQQALGEDYPFFARNRDEALALLERADLPVPADVSQRIKTHHGIGGIQRRLKDTLLGGPKADTPNILFSGHDYKFVDAYLSHLKAQGYLARRDVWGWGHPLDIEETARLRDWADIIFCEWGLANAVWHSQNKREGTRLIVRIHLQEINPRARKFGPQIDVDAVDRFIFVSDRVRQEAIALFGWPEEKTEVIPNYVLGDEYRLQKRKASKTIHLGIVGIIPQRKRFDRAVDVLKTLLERGHDAHLHIKGPRPETLEFMHAPGRKEELVYYDAVYKRIADDPELAGRVHFTDWGNDVAIWYRGIDVILSPSDFESFHYALADGVLSGCLPIVWPWEEAETLYDKNWIVDSTEKAVDEIEKQVKRRATTRQSLAKQKRALVLERYGSEVIFERLTQTVLSSAFAPDEPKGKEVSAPS